MSAHHARTVSACALPLSTFATMKIALRVMG
jgi:hypothetical protein